MIKQIGLFIALYSLTAEGFTQTFTPLQENIQSSFRGIDTYGKNVVG